VLIDADGYTQRLDFGPGLLARDCSDEPSALGPCVALPKGQPGWSFSFSDGTHLDVVGGVASRVEADDSVRWRRDRFAQPLDAVRGYLLLGSETDGRHVLAIDIDTGEAFGTTPRAPRPRVNAFAGVRSRASARWA